MHAMVFAVPQCSHFNADFFFLTPFSHLSCLAKNLQELNSISLLFSFIQYHIVELPALTFIFLVFTASCFLLQTNLPLIQHSQKQRQFNEVSEYCRLNSIYSGVIKPVCSIPSQPHFDHLIS